MTDIPSKYDPASAEGKWYSYWMEKGFFRSRPDKREPYTIIIPPPNVTGVLHMGHMLNNTTQDVLIRRARMLGLNACWVPGTDHASIATEAKVVAKLRSEGIEKRSISREQFVDHAWEWTHKHGGIILEQLKRLGASCDWDRTLFTMDEPRYISVIKVFVDLYNKGLIYRGVRMVNWDPQALTAVSDEEVVYTEEKSKLYYVRYRIVGEDNYIMVATTRPETILGDMAVCANPNDERYAHMKGKKVIVPMANREVPFIFDEYVDMEFGTGCLKITPAHDINDYEIGLKYNLKSIDIFNDNGTISEAAGMFTGKDRFEARVLADEELRRTGALVKVEDYINKIGRSERTHAVIEPKLSLQWFLKMKDISKPALDAVMDDTVRLYPDKFRNVYRHWMENVHDWCISRQLWWGQRIPAWYYNNNEFVVAVTEDEALEKARNITGRADLTMNDLRQDDDVLDTWFSSWLWPITCFDGINNPDNEDIKYYYPSNVLVTAPDILFFWVARMIIAGYEYRGREPFGDVYLTGMVRDKQKRKMSKSLGNSPDPIGLIDRYGADGVRVGMLLCSPAGNDLLYDDSLPEQGRNFANKIWNAFRLVMSMSPDDSVEQPAASKAAVTWMRNTIDKTLAEIEDNFVRYRISDALMQAYKLFWDDFSGWYLEIIKPAFGKPIDGETRRETLAIFGDLMKILHPFMPFITEEIWQRLAARPEGSSIMVEHMPLPAPYEAGMLMRFDTVREIVSAVRAVRKEKNIPVRESLVLCASPGATGNEFDPVIIRMCNLSEIRVVEGKVEGAASFRIGTSEFFVPLSEGIDHEDEIRKLKEELVYQEGFLASVLKKLSNEKFVSNAPPKVLDTERKKEADSRARIATIKESLAHLQK
ncbi:MAG: valine--tRNA ligase [Bacteroidales bacterium]|jgi:valyl-tRNA synthetase|nr:valine--tRNA ligase [Bacteroidales bacterium]MDX9927320.1 valine--tRNA ligase [Bacteroidales bacterium]HOC49046.1 valine--tRNA ligase [Bacteroidales bacterium]